MRHTISIAMTTFNGERFLREQLDSIYSQTLLPDEVVVCDDNSSDGTIGILEEYKQKYGLKYYINNPGLGVNDNFYKTISLCTSDYIALCDQDDVWLQNKIEITYNKLLEIDDGMPAVVSSLCHDIDADGNYINKEKDILDSFGVQATLLTSCRSQGCSLMMNRQLSEFILSIKDSDIRIKNIMFDVFISFVAAIVGHKYNLGNRLMLYRHHDNNVIAKYNIKKRSIKERLNLQNRYVGFIPDQRFEILKIIKKVLSKNIENKDVVLFLDKIISIGESNLILGIIKILLFPYISFTQKLSICVKSVILGAFKLFL